MLLTVRFDNDRRFALLLAYEIADSEARKYEKPEPSPEKYPRAAVFEPGKKVPDY